MTTQNTNNDFSPFLPSTFNLPEEEDRRIEWLGATFSELSDVINDKKIGMYVQDFFVQNGNKYSYDTTEKVRSGYECLLRVTSFPNTGVLTLLLPEPFTDQFSITNVWGSASRPPTTPGNGDYFSFYSVGNPKVTFVMNDLSVVITTTTDMTAYSGFIFIEFIKDGQ